DSASAGAESINREVMAIRPKGCFAWPWPMHPVLRRLQHSGLAADRSVCPVGVLAKRKDSRCKLGTTPQRYVRRMARKSGSADLPLHGGQVPRWLADRMTRLGAVMSEAVVHHYGRDELLRRLAHPFSVSRFGPVAGMDWHSSGITTSVIGALKRGL